MRYFVLSVMVLSTLLLTYVVDKSKIPFLL
jgi:hypothetical protein